MALQRKQEMNTFYPHGYISQKRNLLDLCINFVMQQEVAVHYMMVPQGENDAVAHVDRLHRLSFQPPP